MFKFIIGIAIVFVVADAIWYWYDYGFHVFTYCSDMGMFDKPCEKCQCFLHDNCFPLDNGCFHKEN